MPALRACVTAGVFCFLVPGLAHAGMPTFDLTEVASARLETLSFFAAAYITLTWIFKVCWNVLRDAFPGMPELTFKRAMAFTLVSGLFFWVVLTMISGARELMTPGAWERTGALYKLRSPKEDPQLWLETARKKALENLRTELWNHAKAHGGEFPANRFESAIPDHVWQGVAPDGSFYAYFGDLKVDSGPWIVAYESDVYGSERFVLRADGTVDKMSAPKLTEAVKAQVDRIFTAPKTPDGQR